MKYTKDEKVLNNTPKMTDTGRRKEKIIPAQTSVGYTTMKCRIE